MSFTTSLTQVAAVAAPTAIEWKPPVGTIDLIACTVSVDAGRAPYVSPATSTGFVSGTTLMGPRTGLALMGDMVLLLFKWIERGEAVFDETTCRDRRRRGPLAYLKGLKRPETRRRIFLTPVHGRAQRRRLFSESRVRRLHKRQIARQRGHR
jgi:hypothetical protein